MGLFDNALDLLGSVQNTLGTKNMTKKDYKSGSFSGSQWANVIGGGLNSRSTLNRMSEFLRDPSLKRGESVLRNNIKGFHYAGGYGANLGHHIVKGGERFHRREEADGDTPPDVGPGPGVGSNDMSARQRARNRAIAEARRRRGSTTATTPLGVQGPGADVGKKRLLGE